MKLVTELNLTTSDGTLIGLISLPKGMALLMEGEAEALANHTDSFMPLSSSKAAWNKKHSPRKGDPNSPQALQKRAWRAKQNRKMKGTVNTRGSMYWIEEAKGYRQLSPEAIKIIRDQPSPDYAGKMARKYHASRTTGERVWYGTAAYSYLGPRPKEANVSD